MYTFISQSLNCSRQVVLNPTTQIFVPTIENGEELRFRVCFSFLFHAKSGTANKHRTGIIYKRYKSFFILDSNEIKKFPKIQV